MKGTLKQYLLLFSLLLLVCSSNATTTELPEGAESRFVSVNGIRLHYVTMGQGPLVILLHGWPETSYEWREVMPLLAAHFTLVAPDLRGLGLSEKTHGGYDKKRVASDIAALIKQLGKGPAMVVGHDMGGKVAYVLALLYPELVNKLVLVDCMPPGTEKMDPSKRGSWHYGFHMTPEIPEMLTKDREKEYFSALIKKWTHKKNAISPETINEYASHYATPGGMTAGFNYYRTLPQDGQFLATIPDKKILMPVLTVAGRYGVSENLYTIMSKKSNHITGVIIEESGHFIPEESPKLLAKQLLKFLRS
jgi:pimeloyl-ACP methyl ester carboxylesterase